MEKLIELLNEWYLERYGTNPNFVKFEDYGGNDYGYFCSPDDARLMVETEVWTKKYGFIERLVDNNMIDFEKNRLQVLKDIDVRGEVIYDYTLFDKADGVIMLLSISKNPIEDLISYLK